MNYYYPPINEKDLKILIELSKQHDDYFLNPNCPYSETTKKMNFSNPPTVGDLEDDVGDLEESSMLLIQTQKLYKELQIMGKNMDINTTSAEKNTYFKLSVTLLEKLLNMQERVVNLGSLSRLQTLMLTVMSEEVPVDVRNNIMERLKKSLEIQ